MPTAIPASSAPEPAATVDTSTRCEPSGSVVVPSVTPSGMRVTLMTQLPLATAAAVGDELAGEASFPNDGEAPGCTGANSPCLAAANVDTAGAPEAFVVQAAEDEPCVPKAGAAGAGAAAATTGTAAGTGAAATTGAAAAGAGAAEAGAGAEAGTAAAAAAALPCSSNISGVAGDTPAATNPFNRPSSCESA